MQQDSYDRCRDTYKQIDDWGQSFRDDRWDYLANLSELLRYALIAGHIYKQLPGERVLDAGCGAGILVDYLDLERVDYTGFDLSTTAVGRAQKRLRRGGVVFECPIEEFQPPSGTKYGAIVFNEALQVTETPLESIDRFRKFLTDQG